MEEKKVKEIIKDYQNQSNNDLKKAMDFLQEDFEKTKKLILDLTYHLDGTELAYNNILKDVVSIFWQY